MRAFSIGKLLSPRLLACGVDRLTVYRMRIVVPVDKMDKYVKFSPGTLGKMFDHILAGSEPAKANPRKVGLNKMLKPYLEYF